MSNRDYGKKGYADGGEIREGQNENIGDSARAAAMEWLRQGSPARVEEPRAPRATRTASKPAAKSEAYPESNRASGRSKAEEPESDEKYRARVGLPSAESLARQGDGKKPVRDAVEDVSADIKDNMNKLLTATGIAGAAAGAYKLAKTGARKIGQSIARTQADDIMEAGSKRAASGRESAQQLREMRERAQEGSKARDAARAEAESARRAPKSREDADFADEGNPNYARGGIIGNCHKGDYRK